MQAAPTKRDLFIDTLRGFALFGILVVNLKAFADPFWGYPRSGDPVDDVGRILITFFFSGKFYTLFATLFGLGLAWQAANLRARGIDPKPVLRRRLWWLFGVGAIHGIFLFSGDILATYALLGLFVLRFLDSPRPERIGLIFYAVGIGISLIYTFGQPRYSPNPDLTYATGSFGQMTLTRLWEWSYALVAQVFLVGAEIVGLMLFGFYLFPRWQHFDPPTLKRWLWIGLGVGAIASALDVRWEPQYLEPLRGLGGLGFAVFYACLLRLYWNPLGWLHGLHYAGQMPLTNYLMQSAVMGTVFYGYGLGLYGKVSPIWFPLIAGGVVALQVWLSRWWLGRYKQGPLERWWRNYTYAKAKPSSENTPDSG